MSKASSLTINATDHIAVIDIGSNSIRLVIFKTMGRFPFPLFNERVTCRLGEGLETDNLLQPKRIKAALETLQRFDSILKSLPNLSVKIVATAAARRAKNADVFLKPAQEILNHKIQVLEQQEEAHLVSIGLLSNFNINEGLIADLGGGSLELVLVKNSKMVHSTSLNIGHLSYKPYSEIIQMLENIPWLNKASGLDLFGVGGSFRALGSAYIYKTKYPLGMLHALTISRMAINSLLNEITADPPNLEGIPEGRRFSMVKASEIISSLISISKVNTLIISGTSIRDGIIAQEFLEHPNFTSDRKKDPLHIACAEIAENRLRFSLINEKLYKFIKPCIESSTDYMGNLNATRLVKAACLLSEICWDEEPSMRANLAFEKINALPIYSLSHPERLWISLAIFYRYNGIKSMTEKPISSEFILTHSQQEYAYFIGLGLRFGLIFSAGINTNLDKIKLYLRKQTLTCAITKNGAHLFTSQNQLRLKSFADILSLKTKIIYQN
ncbi:hypothetical protein N9P07_03110 [Alphaproteobacteria bacterium]|nr:hypothetical protein [Alphaproteobacteria bacterium]MDC3311103.1 hypothetical protein [Alphaproteobacteria bacterium]